MVRCIGLGVLRKLFGLKSEEVTGDWRKLHNEEPRDLYSSRIIMREIKWRRMGWAGRGALWGRRERNAGVR
jgi:hypothetical protein